MVLIMIAGMGLINDEHPRQLRKENLVAETYKRSESTPASRMQFPQLVKGPLG